MPGENSNMVGDYTAEEVMAMSPLELSNASTAGFRKPAVASPLSAQLQAAGVNLGSSVPERTAQEPDAGNVWAKRRAGDRVFTCPSGQKCRLRPVQLEALMMEGILDQVTRLEGLAQELVARAQGLPPEKQEMPSREDFGQLLKVVNAIVPLAVADPEVFPEDFKGEIPPGGVTVADIDIMDRIAILNEALSGLQKLDNFRNPG